MAKETVWQRRARKRGAAKADYYPKVDLADEAGADALASVEALATVQVGERDEPVAEATEIRTGKARINPADAQRTRGSRMARRPFRLVDVRVL